MKRAYFITGTDTDVGKTYTTIQLIQYFNDRSYKTAAIKPVSSGCETTSKGLRNADAKQLAEAISMNFPYEHINPTAYKEHIAPHIAAAMAGDKLTVESLLRSCQPILQSAYDYLFIEGAGGWEVPLNDYESVADLAAAFQYPIILVVGMKLGCLNHALLTYKNIKTRKLPFAGWIANCIDPHMQSQKENIATLERHFQQAPITILEHQSTIKKLEL